MILPRYPIFIPTKGRSKHPHTIRFLLRDQVPFWAVVEPSERVAYENVIGPERILCLPHDRFGLMNARNWIKAYSIAQGHARHWQLDDNILEVRRLYRGKRIPCASGPAFRAIEDFVDRYENVGVAGMNYQMFVTSQTRVPFNVNVHVYSCSLVNNAMPIDWRLVYNDDTDFCLQALANGWCTVLFNVFMANKLRTMKVPGGNTKELYQGDGRLKMARALERVWPRVVDVRRRFGRPQHVVRASWTKFDVPLRRRSDIDFAALPPNEYGLDLVEIKPVRSERMRRTIDEHRRRHRGEPA